MHLQKIKSWLFRPQDDMRPISLLIGFIVISAIVLCAFIGPLIYISSYSGSMPINHVMGILLLCSGATFACLMRWGHLLLSAIDVIFDICYLIRRG